MICHIPADQPDSVRQFASARGWDITDDGMVVTRAIEELQPDERFMVPVATHGDYEFKGIGTRDGGRTLCWTTTSLARCGR